MKNLIIQIYWVLFKFQCKLFKIFLGSYAFFSIRAKKIIFSPTLRQLQAADRDLRIKNINRYKSIFQKLEIQSKKTTILDIGANIGYSSLSFKLAAKPFLVDIYSFEPYPLNQNFFKKNINDSNIKLIPFGLGKKGKELEIGHPDYTYDIKNEDERLNTGLVSFVGIDKSKINGTYKKSKIISGDKFCNDNLRGKNISFIKIDVEGFEMEVLYGLRKTIMNHKPVIQVESNPITMRAANIKINDFLKFSKLHNYHIFFLDVLNEILIRLTKETDLPKNVCELFFCSKRLKLNKKINL